MLWIVLLLWRGAAIAPRAARRRTWPSRGCRHGMVMSSVATAAAPTVADTAYYYDRWWPLAFEATTVKNSPSAVELLGANVVLWYNGEAWCTAVDACPHRLARLSEGRARQTSVLVRSTHEIRQ